MEPVDPLQSASYFCDEIIRHANKSNAKRYDDIFIRSCLPLLERSDLSSDLATRIITAQKKLNLLQRPPLHPVAKSAETSTQSRICSSQEEALALYEKMQTATQEPTSKEDLLNRVIDIVCIDEYFNSHLPYPEEVDITSFMQNALAKLSELGIHLTDPERPNWADYKPNALKKLEEI
jgi:hypothetical protein